MNKLIVVGILVIGFFIFPSSVQENDSIEGRLEIVSPTKCINLGNNVDDCEKYPFFNSQNQICNIDNSYLLSFEKDTLIEFLVIESDKRNEQFVHIVINNTSTEYKIVDGFLWVDINYELKEISLISKYFCEYESITFYGRT
jgi:hypothetical protein